MKNVKPYLPARRVAGAVVAALAVLGTSAAYGQSAVSTPAARTPAATFEPGYVETSQGVNWRTPYGECWRAGHWEPRMAALPCDAVAQVSAPARVVAAVPEPAPAPVARPEPAPLVAVVPPRQMIQKITLETDVLFAFDEAELRASGKAKLDEVAQQLKDARVEEVVAIGYTDPIGTEAYNEKLSAERAAAVKNYLVQQGIEDAKVVTEGRGESNLITNGQCEKYKGAKLISCLQPNRRVELEVFGTREVAATETQPAAGATSRGKASGSGAGSN